MAPDRFPLRALEVVYKGILGRSLTKLAFRYKTQNGGGFRPAELYRRADIEPLEGGDDDG